MTTAQLIGAYPRDRTNDEMLVGETGYTVPWAYDPDTGELRTTFSIGRKGGTARMRVTCSAPGEYQVEVEAPVYRPIQVEGLGENAPRFPSLRHIVWVTLTLIGSFGVFVLGLWMMYQGLAGCG